MGPAAGGKKIFFQKQMAHHLLPEIDRQWLGAVTNCFLIRDPAEVITSYIKKNDDPALDDLGFVQQAEIFHWVCEHTGKIAPVIDAKDILQNPERLLRLLCDAVGVEFDVAMLSWPPGLRETDGIWAKYWYDEVAKSISFQPYRPKHEALPDRGVRKLSIPCGSRRLQEFAPSRSPASAHRRHSRAGGKPPAGEGPRAGGPGPRREPERPAGSAGVPPRR